MKKLIIIIAVVLCLAGCEKPNDYLSVNVTEIRNTDKGASILYSVTNESDIDMNMKLVFRVKGDKYELIETDCFWYSKNICGVQSLFVPYWVDDVEFIKFKQCE